MRKVASVGAAGLVAAVSILTAAGPHPAATRRSLCSRLVGYDSLR